MTHVPSALVMNRVADKFSESTADVNCECVDVL